MKDYIYKMYTDIKNGETKEGTLAYMFRNTECAVLNTFVIVWVMSLVFGG